jgi:hypothetical protein
MASSGPVAALAQQAERELSLAEMFDLYGRALQDALAPSPAERARQHDLALPRQRQRHDADEAVPSRPARRRDKRWCVSCHQEFAARGRRDTCPSCRQRQRRSQDLARQQARAQAARERAEELRRRALAARVATDDPRLLAAIGDRHGVYRSDGGRPLPPPQGTYVLCPDGTVSLPPHLAADVEP